MTTGGNKYQIISGTVISINVKEMGKNAGLNVFN